MSLLFVVAFSDCCWWFLLMMQPLGAFLSHSFPSTLAYFSKFLFFTLHVFSHWWETCRLPCIVLWSSGRAARRVPLSFTEFRFRLFSPIFSSIPVTCWCSNWQKTKHFLLPLIVSDLPLVSFLCFLIIVPRHSHDNGPVLSIFWNDIQSVCIHCNKLSLHRFEIFACLCYVLNWC